MKPVIISQYYGNAKALTFKIPHKGAGQLQLYLFYSVLADVVGETKRLDTYDPEYWTEYSEGPYTMHNIRHIIDSIVQKTRIYGWKIKVV